MAKTQQWTFRQRSIRQQLGLSKSAWPGTCLSLSYDWCKSVLSGRIPEEGDYDLDKPYMWTITSQHRAYRATRQNDYAWMIQLCKGDGLALKPELVGQHMDRTLVATVEDDQRIPAGSAVIISSPNHSMAFTKQEGSKGYFFDPNYGQWKVWGMVGDEIVAILNSNGYVDECDLWIMTGEPRDRQHYLGRGHAEAA